MSTENDIVSEDRIDEFTVLQTYSDGSSLAIDKPINEYVVPNYIAKKSRAAAYAAEADPIFLKAQRGEATMEEWQTKVDEIRARYPYLQTSITNVNTTDFDTLRDLNGVDEVRAQAIIDGRPWADVNDLTTIQGISQEMVDSWDVTV